MTIINDGGTTRSRRIRVRVNLDRALVEGEQLHLWNDTRDIGTGVQLDPLIYEWVDTVASSPPGGSTPYRTRFTPASGGQYTDSPVHTVIVSDQLLASVLGVFLPPIGSVITVVEVQTSLLPPPPEFAVNVTDLDFTMAPLTLTSGSVTWVGINLNETTAIMVDTGLSPTDNDSALVLFGPTGDVLVYNDDGWGDGGEDDGDYRSRLISPVLEIGVQYYLAVTQYFPTFSAPWSITTNGTATFPDTIVRFSKIN